MTIWLASAGATLAIALFVFALARTAKEADERAERLFREQLLGKRDPEVARLRRERRRRRGHGA